MLAVALGLAVLGFAAPALAAPRGVATKSSPTVAIDAGDVDIEIEAWSKNRIEVASADLGSGSNVILKQKGARVTVRFDLARGSGGTVKLMVPKKADVRIAARGGDISASGQRGDIRCVTINGDIDVDGALARAQIVSTSGDVDIEGAAGEVEVKTVSGDIDIESAGGRVRAKTVSGNISVEATTLARLKVASVSGDVDFTGALGRGRHGVDSHSGTVTMKLPKKSPVSFDVRSFSGAILDAFAEPQATAKRRYKEHHGEGGPEIEVSTFSGDVEFRPR